MSKNTPIGDAAIFDSADARHQLTALWRGHGDSENKLRLAALEFLKGVVKDSREKIREKFDAENDGSRCAAELSWLQDELIRVIYDFTVTHVYRAKNPSDAERIAIVAQGGYGRGTLAPGSDIDLLFLLPYKQTPWGESLVEYILYMLWDLGFKVGHATRSVDECIRLSRTDSTILTAMLEARFIWGDEQLFNDLTERYRSELMNAKGAAKAFIETKLAERDERHRRSGKSRYLVEPDVKDGKGGMRDLHTLFWIARFVYGTADSGEFIDAGIFTRAELKQFRKCEDFLWTVRCHMHFLSGRGDDKLTFDKQAEMAAQLSYADEDPRARVEHFMRDYFLVAKQVGDLTRIFCAVLEEHELKKAPKMSELFRRLSLGRRGHGAIKESADFRFDAGRINISSETIFQDDPVNLIRLFWLADKYNTGIHPDALKLVTRSLKLIGADLRVEKEANRLFLDILTSKRDPEIILRRMNEAGILGRFIPDFGRIVAHMQFNMYHHYTVDEHLLRSVGVLAEIERGELADQHPLSNEIIHTLKSRRALYVATFLHDIAKGRPEAHSIAGEKVAKKLCPRLGLTPAETETVAWLVRQHLLMSETAQLRDLNDFKSIADFATIVQSPERLKLLLILTVADIKAVGPGVWNGWKGQLLRTLYAEAEPHLSGGHARVSRGERAEAAKEKFAERMTAWPQSRIKKYLGNHYDPYWLNVDIEHQVRHAEMIYEAYKDKKPVHTRVRSDKFTAITELVVYAADHPRLLALMTGACAAAGANIVGAQIFTSANGMAIDTLLIQREFQEDEDEQRRAERVAALVELALTGEVRLRDLLAKRPKPSSRARAFKVEPQVLLDNDTSNLHTVIEVNGFDRTGLLYELTEALFKLNLNIASAHIATFGEKAVDVFYVTDLTNQKIMNANRRAAIKRQLLAVLAPENGKSTKQKVEAVPAA
ncbi:MAG: [protein-PII] uridylyltransferase [Hyphomicrobiales bacterium]